MEEIDKRIFDIHVNLNECTCEEKEMKINQQNVQMQYNSFLFWLSLQYLGFEMANMAQKYGK